MTITPDRQTKGLWITIGLAGAALLVLVISLTVRSSSGAPESSAPNNQAPVPGAAEPWPTGPQAPDSDTEALSSLPDSTGQSADVPSTVPDPAASSPEAPTSKDARPSKIAPMSTSVGADGQTYYLYPIGPDEAEASSAANQPTGDAPNGTATAPTKSEQQAMDTASRWVTALCTWDYRKAWNSNVTAASPLSVGGKPEQIPLWQIAKTDWPAVTAQKLALSCSGVTARVDHGNQSAVGPTKLVVVVNAEQTTTQGGQGAASKQPIEEVRILSLTQLGWRVGPPTAAA